MSHDHDCDCEKETPLPWIVEDLYYIRRRDKDGLIEDVAQADKELDAALIVRAVNAHEYLVDLLKGIRANLEDSNLSEKWAIAAINTAIAKAEGK